MSDAIKNLWAAVSVAAMLASGASAQPWSFTRIVDTDTPVPNGFGTFNISDAFQSVSVYGDRVAFRGRNVLGRIGVYEWRAGAGRAIADQSTIVPRGTKPFGVFEDVNTTSRGVTFYGAASDNSGIFYEDGTTLGHVADRMDSIPDGNGKFVGIEFRHHSVGTSTAFAGRNDASGQPFGIYRSDDGVLSRIADKTMSPPGHAETFTNLVDWRLDGDATCFTAATSNGYAGIFRSQGGQLTKIMDSNDVDPDGHRLAFPQYVRPAGAKTVFNAYTDNNIEGIYIKTSSGIDKLVDETMTPPDGSSATYGGIGTLDYQNNTLIFQAGNDVIYTNYGGTMQRLIGPGDTLDGKRVIAAVFDEHGFDGTTAAFWVIFAGDSSFHYDRAIYTVTIPAPGAAGFALISALALSASPRRPPRAR